jgi:hypothetical protein
MGNQALVMKVLEGVENARPTLKLNICIEAGKTMGGDDIEPIAQSRLSRNGRQSLYTSSPSPLPLRSCLIWQLHNPITRLPNGRPGYVGITRPLAARLQELPSRPTGTRLISVNGSCEGALHSLRSRKHLKKQPRR